jgi:hypothetical protein
MNKNQLLLLSTLLLFLIAIGLFIFSNKEKLALQKENTALQDSLKNAETILKSNEFIFNYEFDSALLALESIDNNPFKQKSLIFLKTFSAIKDSLYSLETLLGQSNSNFSKQLKKYFNSEKQVQFLEHFADSLSLNKKQISSLLLHKEIEINLLTDSIRKLENSIGELSFLNSNGIEINYFGKLNNQKAEGYGVGFYNTGGIYKGNWKDNKRHGNGWYIWANKDKYEGDFVNDKRHGFGEYTFATGEKYIGNWENDLRSGTGKLVSAEGTLLFNGNWVKNEPLKEN